jgi:hypothetical protein
VKKTIILIIFLLLNFAVDIMAQGEINEQDKIFYRDASSVSFMIKDNGMGLSYIYGKRIDFFNKKLYEISFSNIRHAKEVKVTNPYYGSGKSFVFGKKNYPFDLKLGIGKQKKLFKKRDLGSIAIEYFYTYGGSLVLLKPIYYDVLVPVGTYTMEVKEEKFSSSVHSPIDIYGKSSFFKGFREMQFVPGAYMKFGMSFEFSQRDDIIHALDAGIVFSAYIKKVEIMANIDNPQLFFNLFLCYRFGKAIDTQQKEIDKIKD